MLCVSQSVCCVFAAAQFTDEHGEVCPANWTPGAATMKADPEKSLVSLWLGAHTPGPFPSLVLFWWGAAAGSCCIIRWTLPLAIVPQTSWGREPGVGSDLSVRPHTQGVCCVMLCSAVLQEYFSKIGA
jgi:hypothetical protein